MRDKLLRMVGNFMGILIIAACVISCAALLVTGIRMLIGAVYG